MGQRIPYRLVCNVCVCCMVLGIAPTTEAQRTEETAAIGLGVAYGLPILTQLITRSEVECVVEKYADSDDGRGLPMRLDGWPAARRSAIRRADPVTGPTTPGMLAVQQSLRGGMKGVEQSKAAVDKSIEEIKANPSFGASDALNALVQDLKQQSDHAKSAMGLWTEFSNELNSAKLDGTISTNELEVLSVRLSSLRDALELLQVAKYSETTLEYRRALLFSAYDQLARLDDPSEKKSEFEELAKPAIGAVDSVTQMAFLLDAARQLAQSIPDDTEGKNTLYDLVLEEFGLPGLKTARLLKSQSAEAIKLQLEGNSPVISAVLPRDLDERSKAGLAAMKQSTSSAEVALGGTYNSATSGHNLGPIKNEVMQVLLTEGDHMDRITDPKNAKYWREINSVRSSVGAGNHDVVIYLENMATPTLKSAAYDPSKFIEANAMLYQMTFDNVVSLLGTPAGSDDANPLNLISLKEKGLKLENAKRQAANTMLDSLRKVVATYESSPTAEKAKSTLSDIVLSLKGISVPQ